MSNDLNCCTGHGRVEVSEVVIVRTAYMELESLEEEEGEVSRIGEVLLINLTGKCPAVRHMLETVEEKAFWDHHLYSIRKRHDEEVMSVMVMEQVLHQVQACPENRPEFLDLRSKIDLLEAL